MNSMVPMRFSLRYLIHSIALSWVSTTIASRCLPRATVHASVCFGFGTLQRSTRRPRTPRAIVLNASIASASTFWRRLSSLEDRSWSSCLRRELSSWFLLSRFCCNRLSSACSSTWVPESCPASFSFSSIMVLCLVICRFTSSRLSSRALSFALESSKMVSALRAASFSAFRRMVSAVSAWRMATVSQSASFLNDLYSCNWEEESDVWLAASSTAQSCSNFSKSFCS
mmetsp:Transcript_18357/g.25394  ORF Transcript_18357/g.25394 Transcript_18357/m.25394 type:complete len:227 (+) Transcript_18357:2288-2968(+)